MQSINNRQHTHTAYINTSTSTVGILNNLFTYDKYSAMVEWWRSCWQEDDLRCGIAYRLELSIEWRDMHTKNENPGNSNQTDFRIKILCYFMRIE